jgi:hypothetical protein
MVQSANLDSLRHVPRWRAGAGLGRLKLPCRQRSRQEYADDKRFFSDSARNEREGSGLSAVSAESATTAGRSQVLMEAALDDVFAASGKIRGERRWEIFR